MMCTKSFCSVLVLSGFLSTAGMNAGETSEADAKTKALEERVKVLEKRLADMEARLGQNAAPSKHPNPKMESVDELFERMTRDMDRGAFDWDNIFGQNTMPKQFRGLGRKPCLGVAVETVSDELKERFKNDVKEGAFVMSVFPNSAAEKAGIAMGDAITAIDGRAMADSKSVTDAIKAAGKGPHEISISRRGESLLLKVDLNPDNAAAFLDDLAPPAFDDGNGNLQTRTELKVSALEMTDALAKDLNLSDDQKKKMNDVLTKHSKALSEEFNRGSKATQRNGGTLGLSINGNLNELAKKHADDAAKDLAGILDAEQLKKWNDYRAAHSSVSMSQTMQSTNRGAGPRNKRPDPDEKKVEPDRF